MASGLALLLLGIMLGVFVPALRYSARGQTRLELQQAGLLAISEMGRELQRSRSTGLSFGADFLGLHPQLGVDSGGSPVWSDEVRVYQHRVATSELVRLTLPAPAPGPFVFSAVPGSAPRHVRTMASWVTLFQAQRPQPAAPPALAQPIGLKLQLEKAYAAGEAPARVELSLRVSLRGEGQ